MSYQSYTSYSNAPDENFIVDKIVKYVIDLLLVICLGIFIVNFYGKRVEIIGNSMSPTLKNDQVVFVNQLSYALVSPERGEVIAFQRKLQDGSQMNYVKRIVAVPGDTVQIRGGILYVNRQPVELKTGDSIVNAGKIRDQYTLENGEYFVLGDNVNNSEDSRYESIGTVSESEIIGRAWVIAFPFKDIKLIK